MEVFTYRDPCAYWNYFLYIHIIHLPITYLRISLHTCLFDYLTKLCLLRTYILLCAYVYNYYILMYATIKYPCIQLCITYLCVIRGHLMCPLHFKASDPGWKFSYNYLPLPYATPKLVLWHLVPDLPGEDWGALLFVSPHLLDHLQRRDAGLRTPDRFRSYGAGLVVTAQDLWHTAIGHLQCDQKKITKCL